MKTDKILNYLVWVCFILCVGVASIALISFKIEDKTVYKDDTRDYNTNWYLQGEDESITLSYNENVKKLIIYEKCSGRGRIVGKIHPPASHKAAGGIARNESIFSPHISLYM